MSEDIKKDDESCQPRARDEHAWMRAFAGKGELP